MLRQFVGKALRQLFWHNILNSYAIPAGNKVVLAVALVIHVSGPHVSSDFPVFVISLQFVALIIVIVGKVNWIIGQSELMKNVPIAIGSFLLAHHLRVGLRVLPFLLLAENVFSFFPSVVLPFQILQPFPFYVHLFFRHLFFPQFPVV